MTKQSKRYFVYLMTNSRKNVIYTGVTSNLVKRVYQHKHNLIEGFTQKYNVHNLVYFEEYSDPVQAIAREKQIKAGSRKKKEDMVDKLNPRWHDLYSEIAAG
jgi:putative endonuclease